MSKKRRVLTFIAALTLYVLTMPISAFATTTIKVGSGDEFRQAARTVNTAADDEYIIELTNDIQTGEVVFSSYALGVVVRLISNPLVFFPLILVPLLILLILNLIKTYRMAANIARQEEEQAIREAIAAAKEKRASSQKGDPGSTTDPENSPDR